MGFTGLALAFLLALAVPASIAGTSLVGALVVLAVLGAIAGSLAYHRRRSPLLPGVLVVLAVYAAIVVLIHFAAR